MQINIYPRFSDKQNDVGTVFESHAAFINLTLTNIIRNVNFKMKM